MIFDVRHAPGPGPVFLGPLTGAAELGVTGRGAADAIALIDRCFVASDGAAAQPGEAARLSVSDRDRLMASLYQRSYGGQISGTSVCSGCGERFDFDFQLDALLESVDPEDATPDSEGWYHDGSSRFRLPTGADELAAQGLPADRAADLIAERCAPEADGATRERIEARIAEIAPMVDLTLQAPCPECGTSNSMGFNAERYLLSTLLGERRRLMREIHLLASSYHWGLDAILGLSRDDRRGLCAQIERDVDALRKAGAA